MWEAPQCGDSFQFSPFSVLCLLPSNPAHPSSLDCLHSLPARSPLPARLNRPCRSSWLAPLSSFATRSLTATSRLLRPCRSSRLAPFKFLLYMCPMLSEFSPSSTPAQKLLRIPATTLLGLIAITAVLCSFQACSKPATGIQEVQELGSGFRRAIIVKSEKGQLVRYPFFFYKDRPLCQVGPSAPSISPSGDLAVCQDVRTGKIMEFRKRDEKLMPITATPFAPPSRYVWHEQEGNVEAILGSEGFSAVLNLQ